MKTTQLQYRNGKWLPSDAKQQLLPNTDYNLIIAFLSPESKDMASAFRALTKEFPDTIVTGCSTGGQIQDNDYYDDLSVAIAISFEHTTVQVVTTQNLDPEDSFDSGVMLARKLEQKDLCGVFILSEGLTVNGSNLIAGLKTELAGTIPISGGLAGDGANFNQTVVGTDGFLQSGLIVAIGFYGDRLVLNHGYGGGWHTFGPERIITRSDNNILYELDGKPALELYKRYLGEEAKKLPGSALLYPLKIWHPDQSKEEEDIVRTILGIDEETQSLTFAGNMPEGHTAQLMMGTYDNIIQGAGQAASTFTPKTNTESESTDSESLAILVSCIGRKLMLGQRVYEEVEEVQTNLGSHVSQIGFYSYGEICPSLKAGGSELHNQTMTITLLTEH